MPKPNEVNQGDLFWSSFSMDSIAHRAQAIESGEEREALTLQAEKSNFFNQTRTNNHTSFVGILFYGIIIGLFIFIIMKSKKGGAQDKAKRI